MQIACLPVTIAYFGPVNRQTLIIPSVLSGVVIIGFVALSVWQQNRSLALTRTELAELRQSAERDRSLVASLKENLSASQEQINRLQKERDAVTQRQQSLEQEMRAALQSKDITISELQGKLTVSILDRILFDSGEAVLRPEGEQVLMQIARVLSQYPNRQIHVIGHTDNVPIKAVARNRFPSNWELSTLRATAAVRFLCEKAGVSPQRLGAVGYGEYHPIADNATAEGRAKNRRIALVVLSEELVGSDAPRNLAANPSPALATNSPVPAPPASTNLEVQSTNLDNPAEKE
jgi:chemotaxis protein MotB